MNKREKEIEGVINFLDNYDNYNPYQEAWGTVYDYILYLEEIQQEAMAIRGEDLDDYYTEHPEFYNY